MSRSCFFITGFARSGTTLVNNMANALPSVHAVPQPLPLLFVHAKRLFLDNLGMESSYPLSDVFAETHYPTTAWQHFLAQLRIDRQTFGRLLHEMASYSGQYTRLGTNTNPVSPDSPEDLLNLVAKTIAATAPSTARMGLKEVVCEEFTRHMLTRGWQTIHVIRDPRDAIASQLFGSGSVHAGAPRPLLFNIRSWRKSVGYALENQAHLQTLLLNYEDCVQNTRASLTRLAEFLGVAAEITEGDLDSVVAALAADHPNNSSYGQIKGITTAGVGRYRSVMPPHTATVIEALCLPELRTLGYPVSLSLEQARHEVRRGVPDDGNVRENLDNYQWSEERVAEELARLESLAQGHYRDELFHGRESWATLKRGLDAGNDTMGAA